MAIYIAKCPFPPTYNNKDERSNLVLEHLYSGYVLNRDFLSSGKPSQLEQLGHLHYVHYRRILNIIMAGTWK